MNESDAIESFERLGLTNYEAKVFIALQKIGSGTARDVHRITDVPRSQVYSVAENLADRGLIEVQQSTPMQYRPVDVDDARSTLRNRFEREQERAFDYVDRVRRQHDDGAEEKEAIWTLRGRDQITDRVVELIRQSEERVVFGTRRLSLLTEEIEAALRERATSGTAVVVSANPDVRERFADADSVVIRRPRMRYGDDDPAGRVALTDGDALLLSVFGREAVADASQETAIWSTDSNFAAVLIELIEANLGTNDV